MGRVREDGVRSGVRMGEGRGGGVESEEGRGETGVWGVRGGGGGGSEVWGEGGVRRECGVRGGRWE